MSGIYIHIPFCKQACHYCDFHFSTQRGYINEMVEALAAELAFRKEELRTPLHSIYLGGGTPSLLKEPQLKKIMDAVHTHYELSPNPEITLEANPDDIEPEHLDAWLQAGINRLSIGIQSFIDANLQRMNRAHNAEEAYGALKRVKHAGFKNISLDLIYGLPWGSHPNWQQDVKMALGFKPQHISAYALTIEAGTVFGHRVKQQSMAQPDDDRAAEDYEFLLQSITKEGYEAYEVSNFCLPGYESRHNSAYWLGKPYLGIGPGAHSFDGKHRRQNPSHNHRYMKAMAEGKPCFQEEMLSPSDRYNEYLLTALRTKWGVDFQYMREELLLDANWPGWKDFELYREQGWAETTEKGCRLTAKGRLLADEITAKLFAV